MGKIEDYLASFAGPAALNGAVMSANVPILKDTRIAYFRGCGMQMIFPEAVSETIKILNTLTKVHLVDNVCCGLPHISHGLRGDFLKLAKRNISLLQEVDVVVSDCASCSGTLKHTAAFFTDDPEWKVKAEVFTKKIMGLSEFLLKAGYKPRQRMGTKLTFHEPCHLGRGQGIKKEPRELLSGAGDFVEMSGADVCCGGAGSFHIDYPDIANTILEKKRLNIEKTTAQIVVSECPVCLVQLSKAAQRSGGKFQAMHISQVI